MKKLFTLLIALMALCVSSWATTVAWGGANLSSISLTAMSYDYSDYTTVDDITATVYSPESDDYSSIGWNYGLSTSYIRIVQNGTLTFEPVSGKLTGIVIACDPTGPSAMDVEHLALGTEWVWNNTAKTLTWSGDPAASVTLAGDGTSEESYLGNITSIEFTLATVVTWDYSQISGISISCSNVNDTYTSNAIDGVTLTITKTSEGSNCEINNTDLWISDCGQATFASVNGEYFTSVVITCSQVYNSGIQPSADWTYDSEAKTFTWAGTPSDEVNISGNIDFQISFIEFTLVDAPAPGPAPTSVTWNESDINFFINWDHGSSSKSTETLNDITITAGGGNDDYSQFGRNSNLENVSLNVEAGGTLTFSTTLGNFQSIVISYDSDPNYVVNLDGLSAPWSANNNQLTWTGDASSAVMATNGTDAIYLEKITSVVFSFEAAPAPAVTTTTITWDVNEVSGISLNCKNVDQTQTSSAIDGITMSLTRTAAGGVCYIGNTDFWINNGYGEVTFTSSVGNITGIVINNSNVYSCYNEGLSDGWTFDGNVTLTWTGTPSNTVKFSSSYDLEMLISSIEFTVEQAPAPVITGETFEWADRQVSHVALVCSSVDEVQISPVIKNIITSLTKTNSNSGCEFYGSHIYLNSGDIKFKSIVGDLLQIVISYDGSAYYSFDNLPTDWTDDAEAHTLTWVGTAAEEVTLSGEVYCNISSIEFTYTPADAPRVGEIIYDTYQYEITGAHTAKVISQYAIGSIPEYVEDYGVTYYITEVDAYAFQNNTNQEGHIYLGKNIAKIGAHAFEGCYRVSEISLLQNAVLDTIGEAAFKDCKLMNWFTCDGTMMPPVLGANAFSGDNYLNHICVYGWNGVVDAYKAAAGWSEYTDKICASYPTPSVVGDLFFFDNQMTTGLYAVSSVDPKEAKVIPYAADINALYPITRTGTLVIPEQVMYLNTSYAITGIGANAYKDSARFDMVLMPLAVKTIEEGAFRNCTGVEKVFFLWDDPTTVTWYDGAAGQGKDFKTAASGQTKIFVPADRLDAYKAWAPAWADCMYPGEVVDVNATSGADPDHVGRYYRTFYDSSADYMMPPSVWAHVGYVENNEFMLHPIAFDGQIVPKGTAVVLESETAEYRLIPTGNDAPAYTGRNDLLGTDEDLAVSSLPAADQDKVYVLNRQATIGGNLQLGMGMYRYTGTTLGAHKAYMILNNTSSGNAPARFLFRPEHQTPTGVENVQGDKVQCAKILRDGQLVIIKDGKEYNAQGIIIK